MSRAFSSRALFVVAVATLGVACSDATAPDTSSTGRGRRVAAYADAGTGPDTTRGGGGGVGLPILTGTRVGSEAVTTSDAQVRSSRVRRAAN